LPNGVTQVVLQSAPGFDEFFRIIYDWSITSSRGLVVEYQSIFDDMGTWWDISDDVTELTGTATLPNGMTQAFHVLTANGVTDIQSIQSDKSIFTMHVPLMAPDYILPDFSQMTTGLYMRKKLNVVFGVTSTVDNPFRWAAKESVLNKKIVALSP